MSLKTFIGGVAKLVDTTNVFRVWIGAAAAWKDVASVREYNVVDSIGSWKDVWIRSTYVPPPPPPPTPTPTPTPPVILSVSIAPNPIYGANPGGNSVTVSATGDVSNAVGGVKTWQWSLVSWDTAPPSFSAPNAQGTNITQGAMVPNESASCTIKLTVEDNSGNVGSATADCGFNTIVRGGGGGVLP